MELIVKIRNPAERALFDELYSGYFNSWTGNIVAKNTYYPYYYELSSRMLAGNVGKVIQCRANWWSHEVEAYSLPEELHLLAVALPIVGPYSVKWGSIKTIYWKQTLWNVLGTAGQPGQVEVQNKERGTRYLDIYSLGWRISLKPIIQKYNEQINSKPKKQG